MEPLRSFLRDARKMSLHINAHLQRFFFFFIAVSSRPLAQSSGSYHRLKSQMSAILLFRNLHRKSIRVVLHTEYRTRWTV
ncbi:hypothetical protein BDV06DRAFT_184205 [Aspergillus oleicola]